MDEQQRQAFETALEKKKDEAKEKSEATKETPGDTGIDRLTQDSLIKDNTPQDLHEREKSSGHGHKTADKWNQ